MTLSGGCLCCQVRGALAPVLRNIRLAWRRPGAPPFDRVIIETSGVASPEPVLDTLLRDRWLSRNYRLDAIVALLAAPVCGSYSRPSCGGPGRVGGSAVDLADRSRDTRAT